MDRIGAVAMLIFGLFWVWIASGLGLTRDGGPGPGFFPLVLGLIVATLAAINILRPEVDRIELPQLRRILLILAALVGYAILLEPLGYVVSTALLLLFLFAALAERRQWWQPVSALVVSCATYYVFRLVLSVPLPPDPLDLVR
jgi:putative tricarboxylic transport membrane protein